MALAQLAIVIGSDVGGAISGINTVKSSLGGLSTSGGKSLGQLGGDMQKLGGQITRAAAPLAVGFGAGIKMASDFENSMAEIQARTQETPENMKRISDFALQMGADTSFSAGQASDAFLQLLSSGQSTEQAFQSLPGILAAAAASGEDLGTTADTITDIMASFGIEVKTFEDGSTTVEGVANALARAAGASSASMADLGQGFANVGGVANAFGLDVTDTSAVLAIFSENGIKGAEAGTQLKSMLLNMSADTDKVRGAWNRLGTSMYDAEGNMRPLEDIIYDIDTAMDGMSVEEQNRLMKQLGGSYGIMGLTALRGSISITEMKNSMMEQANVSDVAAARMDTFAGRVDSLMGSVETLAITALTPLMDNVLTPMAEKLTTVVNSVTTWAGENPELVAGILNLAGAALVAGPALMVLGTLAKGAAAGMNVMRTGTGRARGNLLALGIVAATTDWDGVKQGLDDWGEGLVNLSNAKTPYEQTKAIQEIDTAFGNIVASTGPGQWADSIIGVIEKFSGQDFASVSEGIASWADNFRMMGEIIGNAWAGVTLIFDNVKRGFELFFLDVQMRITDQVSSLRQTILDATEGSVLGAIDIAPQINEVNVGAKSRIASIKFADAVTSAINTQLASGEGIDLGQAITVDSGTGFMRVNTALSAMLSDPTVIAGMGTAGKMAVEQALQFAFANADTDTVNALLPIAGELKIDTTSIAHDSGIQAQLLSAIQTADWGTVQAIIPLLPQIQLDDPAVREQVTARMAKATFMGDDMFLEFFAPLAVEVGVDQQDVQQQVFSQIIAAAAGTVSTSVGVQVNAAVTNASEIFQSVMAQVNAAIAGSPVGNALGAIGNAIGNIGATIAPPGSVPSAAVGTPKILSDGIIFGHEGESILTAAQTRAYHSGSMAGGSGGGMVVNNWNPTIIGQRPHEVVGMLKRAAKDGARSSRRT